MRKITFFLGLMLTMLATNVFAANSVEVGKFYVLESAYTAFTELGKHACIYTAGSKPAWKLFNADDPSFYMKAEAVNGDDVQFRFFKDGKCISSGLGLQTGANYITLTDIGQNRFGLKVGGASSYTNPKGHNTGKADAGDLTLWGSATSLSNEWYVKEVEMPVSLVETALKDVVNADYPAGNGPGWYDAAKVAQAKQAAKAALADEARTAVTLAAALDVFNAAVEAAFIMPEVGKTYFMISGYSNYEKIQGNKKAAYIDGTNCGWNTLDVTNNAFYWTVTSVKDGKYAFQNVKTDLYLTGAKNPVVTSADEQFTTLQLAKNGIFVQFLQGNATAGLHTNSHSNGENAGSNLVTWGGVNNDPDWWIICEPTSLIEEALATEYAANRYDTEKVEAAKAELKKAYQTEGSTFESLIAALSTYNNAIKAAVSKPVVGKTYMLVSAYGTFEIKQGVKKAAYMDGNNSGWKNINKQDMGFYWTATAAEGNDVALKNLKTGKYLTWTGGNTAGAAQDESAITLHQLADGRFSLYLHDANGNTAGSPMHTNGHNTGAGTGSNFVVWGNDNHFQNQWYIMDASEESEYKDFFAPLGEALEVAAVVEEEVTNKPIVYIESAEQFSSNKPCPKEGSLESLLDNNPTTFFHSDWSGTYGKGVADGYHSIYVDGLSEDMTSYTLAFTRRTGIFDDMPTEIKVYGGKVVYPELAEGQVFNHNTDAASFEVTSGEEPLCVLSLPYEKYPVSGKVNFNLGETGYEALAFVVTNTHSENGRDFNPETRAWFHFGEFQLEDPLRIEAAKYDAAQEFVNVFNRRYAVVQALSQNIQFTDEYKAKIQESVELLYASIEDIKANSGKNKVFAEGSRNVVDIKAGVKGSKYGVAIPFSEEEIKTALNVPDFTYVKQVAINGQAGYKQDVPATYVTETGYRDADGNVCAKKDASLQVIIKNDKLYVNPAAELEANNRINVYTVFTSQNAAYLIYIQTRIVADNGDGATAINGVNANVEAAGVIYDLQGRKVSSVKAGQIYIVGGKKIMF